MAVWYVGSTKYSAVTQWAATTAYNVGDLRRQLATATAAERVFRCTTAGTSGGSEPTWTLTAGGTTNDGTAVWTEVTGNSTYGWTAPHSHIANALGSGWAAAGDTIYVSQAHAGTRAASLTYTSLGTASSPITILCVNDGATPPTTLTTGATETASGASSMTFLGFASTNGVSYVWGTGSSTAASFTVGSSGTPTGWRFENGGISTTNTNSAGNTKVVLGITSGTYLPQYCEWVNWTVSLGNAGQLIQPVQGRFTWRNTPSAIGGTTPTTLFIPQSSAGNGCQVDISGVDLSALGSGKSLANIANSGNTLIKFRNCKLGASVSITTGTIPSYGGTEVYLDNADSAATNYRMEHYKYQGSIIHEATKVRTSGASDGTTPLAWKMTTLSSGPSFDFPLSSPPVSQWIDSIGSAKTATIEILHDSTTNLKDDEVWLEIEYLSNAATPASTIAQDRKTDYMATAADQDTSSATWTTTGITNANKQKLVVTFTPQMKGLVRARVMLAKANYTIYVDPLLTIS